MNNWEKLCELINSLIKKDVDEDLFHLQFESYLKTIFNWDDASIKHKPPVRAGRDTKQADTVLSGEKFGIVIEMKRPSAVLGDDEAEQLFSYMLYLKHKYGLLVGNEIKVFYDDDTDGEKPIEVASFGFDSNNPDGAAFCEILDKNVCSNEKLKEYATERINRIKTKREMERLKKELLENNGEQIKSIVTKILVSGGLPGGLDEQSIQDILEDISISLKQKPAGVINTPAKNINTQPNNSQLGQIISEVLQEYKEISIVSSWKDGNWINFSTEKMNKVLTPRSGAKNGSWHDGTKYHYWFEVESARTCLYFELGPREQDDDTIAIMNKITHLCHKHPVSSQVDEYRRIAKWQLSFGFSSTFNEESVIAEVKETINRLFVWEENCIKKIV
ncbi:MAG: hypothetical protein Ta2A_08460 [Treponemataceae bacterium]|nr:MAG: hypothetical protein Ta2A_08460 [Treponemataceae bacterium]